MLFFLPHLIAGFTIGGFYLGGVFNWTAVLIIFFLFPLIELLTRHFHYQPEINNSRVPHVSLYLLPISLTAVLLSGFVFLEQQPSFFEKLGLILSAGCILGAFGITGAHELIHRNKKWERALGVYNLMLVNFAHWGLEHVFGHHKNVGTDHDPATAKLNENIYSFWCREYLTSLKSAYLINSKKMTTYWLISLVMSGVIYLSAGLGHLLYWWGVSFVAILLLQTVDYIEHYGLKRERRPDGTWAAFTPAQAWDSSSYLTNLVLFNLGLHAHHHLKASLPYTSLQIQGKSPKMPVGYSFMVLFALFPFWFIPMMNSEIQKNNK